ncbi:DNA methyltransferase [Thaumasiovibrio sp. DFM-14]|uniref:DNA methyltransferase n=1 Tax=Thaumasiovibrio sp. DFM-14 TaxID=3384792 RepID=UPI0039A27D87
MSSTNGQVRANEVYPTPKGVIDALLAHIQFREDDRFLEPCCGTPGEDHIYTSVPLPEGQKAWAELRQGVDYLTTEFGTQDVIITNPPFSLTKEFLRKSFSELAPDGTLIYLQRMNYLGSFDRVPFWQEIGFPDKTPILVPRPSFTGKGSDSCEYSWMIWDRGGRVASIPDNLSHLVWREPVRRKAKPKAKATSKKAA